MPTTTPSHFTSGELGDFLGVQAWKISRLFELGIVEDISNLTQRKIELFEEQDLLQAQQVLLLVKPVAHRGSGGRL